MCGSVVFAHLQCVLEPRNLDGANLGRCDVITPDISAIEAQTSRTCFKCRKVTFKSDFHENGSESSLLPKHLAR